MTLQTDASEDKPTDLYPNADGKYEPASVPLGMVDMTNEEYQAAPGVSSSQLSLVHSSSMLHYWDRYVNPDREPDQGSDAMRLGTAIHTAILEPHHIENRIIVGLDVQRRSNADKQAWAEFEAQHKGKIILKQDVYDDVLRIRDRFYKHPEAPYYLTEGRAEQSIFAQEVITTADPETGEIIEAPELIKCQPDFMRDAGDYIVDVKSTTDASPEGFGKSISNYRYYVQAAWYRRVLKAQFGGCHRDWVWIAFEPVRPYAIGIYWAEPDPMERAAIAADRDFMKIVQARRTNSYPDYGCTPQSARLPAWDKL